MEELRTCAHREKRFDDAVAAYTSALAVCDQSTEVGLQARLFGNRAASLIELGNYFEAVEDCERALNVLGNVDNDADYASKITMRRNRAQSLFKMGKACAGISPDLLLPNAVRDSFEYFPVGHDTPQDMLMGHEGDYRLGQDPDDEKSRENEAWSVLFANKPVRVLQAATSDPRHALCTLSLVMSRLAGVASSLGIEDSFRPLRDSMSGVKTPPETAAASLAS